MNTVVNERYEEFCNSRYVYHSTVFPYSGAISKAAISTKSICILLTGSNKYSRFLRPVSFYPSTLIPSYPCTDRLQISRNTVSRERFIIALQSRMQERDGKLGSCFCFIGKVIDATSTGKYSLSLRLFDSAHSSSLDIPYSPGNIFTKRGGSQLADSKERFDGCVWKVKCRFSQIESGWETIVRSLEWRRRIQPSCCFEPFPHACTFVISAFPLLERLTGHRARKRLGRDVISCVPCFKYFKIEIIQNRAIFLNGCDVFSFLTITVIVNGRGKGGNANCSRN